MAKYLINDYYSEFLGNVRDWASRLRIVSAVQARPEEAGKVDKLHQLYGERVLTKAVLSVLNNGCGVLEHALKADTSAECDRDPDDDKRGLVATLVEVGRACILVVSDHPTYTRFFTFREHLEALALLDFLGCHEHIMTLASVSSRVKNTTRLRRVNQFFRRADARDYLRRTVGRSTAELPKYWARCIWTQTLTNCPPPRLCWALVWTCCSVFADTKYIPSRCT